MTRLFRDRLVRAAEPEAGAPPVGSAPQVPPDGLIIVPVRNAVLFPGTVFPIALGRERSVAAAQQAVREERPVGLLMQRDPELADPSGLDLHRTGTVANILRYVNAPDGSHHVVLQGEQRFRVVEFTRDNPFFVARIVPIEEPLETSPEIEARFLHLRQQALEALQLLPQVPQELIGAVQTASSPAALTNLVAAYLDVEPDQKQEILETIDLTPRMEKVSRLLAQRIEVLRLTHEIGRQTKAAFDERQREAVLREQMAAIQRQLGEADGKAQEIAELNEAIAKARMPAEVESQARKELHRYERMPEAAAESGMIRTYLDWLMSCPGRCPRRGRSTSPRRGGFSTRTISASKRSSNASSSISPCAS